MTLDSKCIFYLEYTDSAILYKLYSSEILKYLQFKSSTQLREELLPAFERFGVGALEARRFVNVSVVARLLGEERKPSNLGKCVIKKCDSYKGLLSRNRKNRSQQLQMVTGLSVTWQFLIFTDHVRGAKEGDVFTDVCHSAILFRRNGEDGSMSHLTLPPPPPPPRAG